MEINKTLSIVFVVAVCLIQSFVLAVDMNDTELFETMKKFDLCTVQSTYSFHPVTKRSNPPRTVNELITICKYQADGVKCLKEKTKGTPPLIRRGMQLYVQVRQRHHRKYCTNPNSELSKKFVDAHRCILDKTYDAHARIDEEMGWKLIALSKKTFNDTALELKQICCTFYTFKQKHIEQVPKECAPFDAQSIMEETMSGVVPQEMNIICDDEDKLLKICPKLEPLQIPKPGAPLPLNVGSASSLALYLIATLGTQRSIVE